MQPLNRQNRPPDPGPEMLILRLRAGQRIVATILSKALWGVWTHWAGKRSEPCFGDKADCPGHKRGLPLRWKGYLHVFDHTKKKEGFLELTPVSAESLLDQVGNDSPLRGERIQVIRGGGDKARLTVELLAAIKEGVVLPPEKDPEKTLRALWGIERPQKGSKLSTAFPMNEQIG